MLNVLTSSTWHSGDKIYRPSTHLKGLLLLKGIYTFLTQGKGFLYEKKIFLRCRHFEPHSNILFLTHVHCFSLRLKDLFNLEIWRQWKWRGVDQLPPCLTAAAVSFILGISLHAVVASVSVVVAWSRKTAAHKYLLKLKVLPRMYGDFTVCALPHFVLTVKDSSSIHNNIHLHILCFIKHWAKYFHLSLVSLTQLFCWQIHNPLQLSNSIHNKYCPQS